MPGRLQVVSRDPLLLADGAHNPAGMRALVAALAPLELPRPVVAVMAVMRDKDVAGVLGAILPLLDAVVCTRASEPRSLTADELARAVASRRPWSRRPDSARAAQAGRPASPRRRPCTSCRSPARRCATARTLAGPAGTVLVTGSLYLLEDLAGVLGAA